NVQGLGEPAFLRPCRGDASERLRASILVPNGLRGAGCLRDLACLHQRVDQVAERAIAPKVVLDGLGSQECVFQNTLLIRRLKARLCSRRTGQNRYSHNCNRLPNDDCSCPHASYPRLQVNCGDLPAVADYEGLLHHYTLWCAPRTCAFVAPQRRQYALL